MKYKLCRQVVAIQLSLLVDINVLHCCRLHRYIVYLLPWWQSQENYVSLKNKWNKKKFKKFKKVRQLLPGSNVCQTPSSNWQGWCNLQFNAYQSFTWCGRMQVATSLFQFFHSWGYSLCWCFRGSVCVCVCVWERERERVCVACEYQSECE